MNLKSLQRRFPRIQPIEITPGNTELIHDDRLFCEFDVTQIQPLNAGNWAAQVVGAMDFARPTQMLAVISDVIESNPDYTAGDNYGIVVSYERFHIEIPFGPDLDELRSSPDDYINLMNLLCLIYYEIRLDAYFRLDGLGRFLREDEEKQLPDWAFMPMADNTLELLINAVRGRQYIPLQQGIGITSPGKPMKFYTSGAAHFTDHPGLGTVPGGMRFIDLSTWDGEFHNYTEDELGTIE
ncbi:hypothetical protein PAQ31011_03626 [Pandoraea aquatica]|uniref:Uncharacterized protein n=1 Tax=Pandoraea aquatica TaxID=2508290 RepID=A0A5E4X1H6_9BURK|nr:hypothetical protein [Pandoraea aquatica]VVE30181.1 hypothetical protein PAQ31011_03626 [Pandoraea aquatica]